jgi:outer membrane protein assembly factor BamB
MARYLPHMTSDSGNYQRAQDFGKLSLMKVSNIRSGSVLASLATLACVLGLAACGSSSESVALAPEESTLIGRPLSGDTPERTHYFRAQRHALDPPLSKTWSIGIGAPTKFPPIVTGGVVYIVSKYGRVRAVQLRGGKTLWEQAAFPLGSGPPPEITPPAYSNGRLLLGFAGGPLVVLDGSDGKFLWEYNLNSYLDSAPLEVHHMIYIVANRSNLLALKSSSGTLIREISGLGEIKSSPSYHDGRIYVGDDKGSMICIDATSGEVLWQTNTNKGSRSDGDGFYSSPAISFGHVYADREDGTVFAFDEKSGKVVWSFPTHSFIHGSPAVAKVPGTPPSIYVGSFDKHLYAIDALSGKQRWSYGVGTPVSGSAIVVGHTIYFSTLNTRKTLGLDIRTHRRTFELGQAGYTPLASDSRRIYMFGHHKLIGLEPARTRAEQN